MGRHAVSVATGSRFRFINKESPMAVSAAAARHIEGSSVGWRFWLRWFLACLAGFVVGIPLFIGLGLLLGDAPGPVVGDAAAGVIHGAEFGIAQLLQKIRRANPGKRLLSCSTTRRTTTLAR